MKKFIKDIFYKKEWLIAIGIAGIMWILFSYIDLKSLTIWSTNMLDVIAKGDIKSYFSYTALNLHGLVHQYVSGTLYSLMAWGIWNIPIWIVQYFFHVEILQSSLCLLWSKLFLVAALIITLKYTYKTIYLLIHDKKLAEFAIYLSFSFVFTYIGIFYAGQNDILICMLGILSLYCLIKKSKTNMLFYIFSGFAISVKYFFFIPYILIILLMEKNIIKVITKVFIGLIPTLLFILVASTFPMYSQSGMGVTAGSALRLFSGNIPFIQGYSLSLFLIIYVFLAFLAYSIKPKDNLEMANYLIYFTVAGLSALLLFSSQNFYRPILLMPFIFIMFALNKKRLRINIILESIISLCMLVTYTIKDYNFFSSQISIYGNLFERIFNLNHTAPFANLAGLMARYFPNEINYLGDITTTISASLIIILLIINYPRGKIKLDNDDEPCEKYIIILRAIMIVPLIIYMLYGYFA